MISIGCVTDADCGIHGKCNHDSHTCSCSDVSPESQCQDSGKGAFLQHVLIFLKKYVICDILTDAILNMFSRNKLLIHHLHVYCQTCAVICKDICHLRHVIRCHIKHVCDKYIINT